MIKKFILTKRNNEAFLINATFENKNNELKENHIYDNPETQESLVYLGLKSDFNLKKLSSFLKTIISNENRVYQLNVNSFVNKNISEDLFIKEFVFYWYEIHGKNFNLKTTKSKTKQTFLLTKENVKKFDEDILIASQMCEVRTLQNTAPNILTISKFCTYISDLAKNNKALKLKFLEEKEMLDLKMNLILSVNKGSKEKAKCAVIEYKGNSQSKEKITFVGKGIIFDSGGYNLKTPGKYMLDMKFDMSGAALAVLLVDTLAKMKVKKNISCVVPITDNLIDANGQVPESVWTSMSGKTVEVANTDAEGRLILADALTYAAKKLKSSLIIDMATLTGAVLYALGRKYNGVWSTNDSNWHLLEKASKNVNEFVWRLPLEPEYIEPLTKNTVADTLSCLNVASPDSSVAATWLNQFTMGIDYIHLDIAATADIDSKGQAPMFKTLIEFVKLVK